MKKYISVLIISVIFSVMVIYLDYKRYSMVTNEVVANMIENIKNNYPSVKEEELIKIINGESDVKVIKKYGFLESDVNYLKKLNKVLNINIVINIVIVIVIVSLVYLKIIINKKRKIKEIDNITNYLKKINSGVYDLEIIDNKEDDLSILKNEIYKTVVSLRTSLEKISSDKIVIKDNLANIAHQLKTPLTSILLMIDMIIHEDLSKECQYEFLKDIEREIENINFLIIEMLKLSKFDTDVVLFKRDNTSIKDIVDNAIKNVDILREVKNINIIENGVDSFLYVDKSWQVEALTNIVKNAIEHSSDNKSININYFDRGICSVIEVIDEGEGIKPKDLKHIFDRFYKCSENENNFGIGLSLAKEIIKKDRGIINVSSSKNGTKFVIKYFK